jgi:sulfite exporter TauE/SafE
MSPSNAALLHHQAIHQLGRVSAYGLLGALCGSVGGLLGQALNPWLAVNVLRLGAALLIIAVGAQVLLKVQPLKWLERLGRRLWRKIAPVARQVRGGTTGSLLIGALWGLMPCGLVYSMLAIAALSGSPITGATLMLAFGAGTIPAVMGGSLVAGRLQRASAGLAATRLAGVLLLIFGVWTAYSAIHP